MPVALSTWAQLGRHLDNFESLRCRQPVDFVEGVGPIGSESIAPKFSWFSWTYI